MTGTHQSLLQGRSLHCSTAKKLKLGLDSVLPTVFFKNETQSLSKTLDNLHTWSVREQGVTGALGIHMPVRKPTEGEIPS